MTLLQPSEKEFQYRFIPGVEKWQMNSVMNELKKNFDESKIPFIIKKRNTNDYYVNNPNKDVRDDRSAVRLSYLAPKTEKDKPIDSIWKEKVAIFDFHSPCHNLDFENKHNISNGTSLRDFRIAVNLEHKENYAEILSSIHGPIENSCILERRRERETLEVSNFVMDTTYVVQVESRRCYKQHESYELELELKPSYFIPLLKSYIQDVNGGNLRVIGTHPFIKLLNNFVNLVFGITLFLNNQKSDYQIGPSTINQGNCPNQVMDLTSINQPKEIVEAFKNFVSPITPIIGDYLYRAVASEKLLLNRQTDIIPKDEIYIYFGLESNSPEAESSDQQS
ncbi:hypothetical protein FG386_003190 [Cryptosporidium ryanae]|uniref:uncharacterized protein n=1 Tax=Cryptosporidium ryanae TaxID=515981 RepID=UPI00351A5204|nr:hypothetical protein FG386_003190 [Cryptosporidium ryanae]